MTDDGKPRWDLLPEPLPSPVRGVKSDDGKARWDLLPWEQVESVVRVLGFGARKYAPDNWMHIEEPRRRYIAAALRHVVARCRGEVLDPETGEPHAAHAVCCLLFLMWHDDRARRAAADGT